VDAVAGVLWDYLIHQGNICSEAVLAVPFVFDILDFSPALARSTAEDDPQEQGAWGSGGSATRADFLEIVAGWLVAGASDGRRRAGASSDSDERRAVGGAMLDAITAHEYRLHTWKGAGLAEQEMLLRMANPAFVPRMLAKGAVPSVLAIVLGGAGLVDPRVVSWAADALVALNHDATGRAANLLRRADDGLDGTERQFLSKVTEALRKPAWQAGLAEIAQHG